MWHQGGRRELRNGLRLLRSRPAPGAPAERATSHARPRKMWKSEKRSALALESSFCSFFSERQMASKSHPKIEKNRKILFFCIFGKFQSRSKVKKRPQIFILSTENFRNFEKVFRFRFSSILEILISSRISSWRWPYTTTPLVLYHSFSCCPS